MGKNRRKGLGTKVVGREGGSTATVCTMYLPGPSSHSLTRIVLIGLPDTRLSKSRSAYILLKGQSRYRHPRRNPLSERKVFSSKGLPLFLRKLCGPSKTGKA